MKCQIMFSGEKNCCLLKLAKRVVKVNDRDVPLIIV